MLNMRENCKTFLNNQNSDKVPGKDHDSRVSSKAYKVGDLVHQWNSKNSETCSNIAAKSEKTISVIRIQEINFRKIKG